MSRASGSLDEQAVGVVVAGERQSIGRGGHARMVVDGATGVPSTNVHTGSPRTSAAVAASMAGGIGAARQTVVGDEERRPTMASTPMVRADAYRAPALDLILLMLILASLGIVAHAATL